MDVVKAAQLSGRTLERVVVHPLVLLSIVDHYNRVARDTRKRVVGVLLGTSSRGSVDVTNSYAVPFEEDDKDPRIWFLDHNYHESMFSMFKRINAKEHVVGWYSTGPKLRENDLDVHALFNRYLPQNCIAFSHEFCLKFYVHCPSTGFWQKKSYVPNPVLVIIDVQPKELGIPTKAYYAVEEVKENATQKSQKVFVHVPSEIAAHEVEEIGVEHLLRDVKDTTISTLATEVTSKLAALKGLDARLREIRSYLDLVIEGKLPLNHEILYHLQNPYSREPYVVFLLYSENKRHDVASPVSTNLSIGNNTTLWFDRDLGGSTEAAAGDLTSWQERHAVLVLSKAKELAKIRYDLCPRHLKDKQFWRIYFLLAKSYISPYELRAIQKEKLRRMETENCKPKQVISVEVEMQESKRTSLSQASEVDLESQV
ncbi:26S proteasome non-ATPase regulatory subunit 7 A [Zea mays]|uniref:26S proteasome non-ATPase regulatory subunit 7 A n=1 Tax=Zea mays TaxID=4577 RepID=A0A3L6G784_MAIZE|nr:26S proteasome non-ATPase regulatory subunit 7 A [Zea mays]